MITTHDLAHILQPEECEKVLELYEVGKLTEDWANVADHCAAVAFVTHELAILRGFPRAVRWRLVITAACHDARKRLEKLPDDFTAEERDRFEELWRELRPDEHLMTALLPSFHLSRKDGEEGDTRHHVWYADDICRGSEVVRFKERIDEVEARNPDPDPEVSAIIGKYWPRERWVGELVEQQIFDELKACHVKIEEPAAIPDVVRMRIEVRLAYTQKMVH